MFVEANFVPLPVSREGQDRPFTSSTKIEKLSFDPLNVWLMTIRLMCGAADHERQQYRRSISSNFRYLPS
jgi:hypothetical protein